MDNTELWLWLAQGLGPCTAWLPLWERYENIRDLWEDRGLLAGLHLVNARQNERLLACSADQMSRRRALHEGKGIRILTWDEEDYPAQLRAIDSPPPVLYLKGDASMLQNSLLLSVIGTRHPTPYGIEATRLIADGLAEAGAVLVSGLAEGLDSEAHKAALRRSGPTVGVLGTDLETYFPARNRALQDLVAHSGVLVSEYPCGDNGFRYKETFVQRNRLIAGLSRGVVVAEARLRSGTMSTVRYAEDYGRDVFAVPGSIFSELSVGTNQLLKKGARPVTCAQDVLDEYNIAPPAEKNPVTRPSASAGDLTGSLKTVYDSLESVTPLGIPELGQRTGIAPGVLMSLLMQLEMRSLAKQLPGRRFCKNL